MLDINIASKLKIEQNCRRKVRKHKSSIFYIMCVSFNDLEEVCIVLLLYNCVPRATGTTRATNLYVTWIPNEGKSIVVNEPNLKKQKLDLCNA